MRFLEDIRKSDFEENDPLSRLEKVISDLKEGRDIEGALLVDEEDAIIACALPENTHYEAEIPKILALLEKRGYHVKNENHKVMFAQHIFEYNGYKILAKKLKDKLILLVMMKKRGYVSLAMLDIENTIRRIDEIILEQVDFNDTASVCT